MNNLWLRPLAVTLMMGLCSAPGSTWAGARLTDLRSTCTTLNCSSTTVNTTYGRDQFENADPAAFQVFTVGDECVRIEVTAQDTDLEATLTCPDGTTWRDDDGGDANRPLIQAITPSDRGWCTLTFSHFSGAGEHDDFTFRYGRYVNPNPNCASPTRPLARPASARTVETEEEKADTPLKGGASGQHRPGGSVD